MKLKILISSLFFATTPSCEDPQPGPEPDPGLLPIDEIHPLESDNPTPYQEPGSDRSYPISTLSFNFVDQSCGQIALKERGLFLGLTSEDLALQTEAVKRVTGMVPEGIQAIPTPQASDQVDLEFRYQGIKLCRHDGRALQRSSDIRIFGRIPKNVLFDKIISDKDVWNPDGDRLKTIVERIRTYLQNRGILQDTPLTRPDLQTIAERLAKRDPHPLTQMTQCLADHPDRPNQLLSCLEINFVDETDRIPYQAVVCFEKANSNQYAPLVVEATPFILERSGTITARRKTTGDALAVATSTVKNLSDGGKLCDPRFQTWVPRNVPGAFSLTGEFNYPPDDVRSREVAFFAHVTGMADWMLGTFGTDRSGRRVDESGNPTVTWPGPQVLLKIMYTDNYGRNNRATYWPKIGEIPPRIEMGLGDGAKLKNLLVDPEATEHETVHHLAFRYMASTRPVILHEAIADFFVHLKNGNRCLAEQVCPAGTTICISDKCLRSSNIKDLKVDSPEYEAFGPRGWHRKSQAFSGFLFDIVDRMNGEGIRVGQLVFNAMRYLTPSTSIQDFMNALAEARLELGWTDEELCHIKLAAINRGIGPYLDTSEEGHYKKPCPGE